MTEGERAAAAEEEEEEEEEKEEEEAEAEAEEVAARISRFTLSFGSVCFSFDSCTSSCAA